MLLQTLHHSTPALSTRQLLLAAELITQSDGLIIASGTGMGFDSGLPDLGSDTGLWRAYPALAARGLRFSDLCSPRAFRDFPELAWGFYGQQLLQFRRTRPHAGHAILLRWMQQTRRGGFVYTSSIDGQFQSAGLPIGRIHECHGSVHALQCLDGCSDAIWSADALKPQVDPRHTLWLGPLPRCPHCGALARPNVLMYSDGAWLDAAYDQQFNRMAHWLGSVQHPVVIEIGAGTSATTVRHLSERLVDQFNAHLVRINPRDCEVSRDDDVGLQATALDALQGLDQLIGGGAAGYH
ncbi:MAG: hypothetical protein RJA44_1826 [Pseudomonadota bacterium]